MDLKNLIVYHIFIDRFNGFDKQKDDSKPERIGGNLRGIIKKLPYIKDLGANCIWISPFLKSSSYHGYDIEDFLKVDENVGSEEDLKELISKAHRMNIKVITDFVPNHCSEKHPFFLDAINNPKSRYRSWFYFKSWPHDYLSFLHFKNLPKLNLENPEVSDYMLNVASYWFDMGIDGFRVDHAIGVPKDFLKRLQDLSAKRKKFLIGEVWLSGVRLEHKETIKGVDLKKVLENREMSMEDYAIKELDVLESFLDFTFNSLIKNYVKGNITSEEFYSSLEKHYNLSTVLFTFLDNHDMNRFIFEVGNDKDLLKLAATLQFMMSQPAIIYYGDEVGLSQAMSIEEIPEHGDVQARRRMEWEEQDKDILNHYKTLCRLRKKIYALREGSMKSLYVDKKYRLLAILKESKERVLGVFNPDNMKVVFNLQLESINAKRLVDLFERNIIKEKSIRVEIQPKSFKLFLVK